MSSTSGTMTLSNATTCRGWDATSQSKDWNRYGGRNVFKERILDSQNGSCVDGRTQETLDQQMTVPPTSHRRPVFCFVSFRIGRSLTVVMVRTRVKRVVTQSFHHGFPHLAQVLSPQHSRTVMYVKELTTTACLNLHGHSRIDVV